MASEIVKTQTQAKSKTTTMVLLFVFLVLTWGCSWSATKIALQYMPPLWFTSSRLIIAMTALFGFNLITRNFIIPRKRDLPLILSVGLLNIGAFLICINIGLQYIDAGRAAILAYTTPFWVTPIAVIFFGERLTKVKIIGLSCGFVGVLLLFNPLTMDWSSKQHLLGDGLLLCAAACWAAAMLHTRHAKWHRSAIQLIPWQLFVANIPVVLLASIFEPNPTILWNTSLIDAMLFLALICTAFGFWSLVEISKYFPVITTSLCLLAVPVVGLLASHVILHEKLTLNLLAALVVILFGLACMVVPSKK